MMFEEDNLIDSINFIEIWVETRGRKADTYVSNWNITDDELKEHLKTIKKKKGCNGSIKEIERGTGKIKVMQFQGDVKYYISDYLTNIGIFKDNIKIKL